VLIVGAGPAGIGAASMLQSAGVEFELVEAENGPGGLMRSDEVQGFSFDRAGHFLHYSTDQFRKVVDGCGIDMEEVARRSAVILDGRIIPYPLQFNLWAADPVFRTAVLADLSDQDSVDTRTESFHATLTAIWGPTLTERFFRPYNEKMWGRPLASLPADCGARFIPKAAPDLVRLGAEAPVRGYGYNRTFVYPRSGRIQELADRLSAPFANRIRVNTKAGEIDLARRTISLNGNMETYDVLIHTGALSQVVARCNLKPARPDLFDCAELINLRVGFEGAMQVDDHWHYVPDPEIPFFRVGYPGNINPGTCPSGCASLSIELEAREWLKHGAAPQRFAERALAYLAELDILTWRKLCVVDTWTISPAYVVHRENGRGDFARLFEELSAHNVHMAGRYGRWEYFSLEEAYLSGVNVATSLVREHR
jgi:protoporphyrinogen oxidase